MTPALVLAMSAGLEVLTGLALIIAPETLVQLVFGSRLSGAGMPVAHVTGIALLCLGIAFWPYPKVWSRKTPALVAPVIYNLLVAAYLAYLGNAGEFIGPLLWPVALLHGVIGMLLAFVRLRADTITA